MICRHMHIDKTSQYRNIKLGEKDLFPSAFNQQLLPVEFRQQEYSFQYCSESCFFYISTVHVCEEVS